MKGPATTASRSLVDLAVGDRARIVRVDTNGAIGQRLLDMGITRGAVVLVKRLAPLGDPIEINVKGYDLAVRRSEARSIYVDHIQGTGG